MFFFLYSSVPLFLSSYFIYFNKSVVLSGLFLWGHYTNSASYQEKIRVSLNSSSIIPLNKVMHEKSIESIESEYFDGLTILDQVEKFNHQLIEYDSSLKILSNDRRKSTDGSSGKLFFLGEDRLDSTWAYLKKELKEIDTAFGPKTLKIWVSEESFNMSCITQEMVDILARSFLTEGDNNDIYDWVTNVFGEEWGSVDEKKFIEKQDEINILLTDIEHDNKIAGAISGYFYAKDTYRKAYYSGSNESLIFYIDAPIFASHSADVEWSIHQPQPKKILSVLAHEFEHMIFFYQKKIKLHVEKTVPWVDELLAISIEDLLATKLNSLGIRGVPSFVGDAGEYKIYDNRLARFNKNIEESVLQWDGELKDYSKVASFGAYLIRNYHGATVLHNIMHNAYGDEAAIVMAVNHSLVDEEYKDFDAILQDWGIAILLSSEELDQPKYQFNRGDFFDFPYGDTLYSVGSINFFNYYIQPTIRTIMDQSIEPHANLYYKVADVVQGELNIKLNVPDSVQVALISK